MGKTKAKHNGKESDGKKRKEDSKQPNPVDDDSKNIYVPEDTMASPLHNETTYSVSRGVMHEGASRSTTFIYHANALKFVECLIARDKESGIGDEWELESNDHWISGCDYIVIYSNKFDDCSRFKLFKEYRRKNEL